MNVNQEMINELVYPIAINYGESQWNIPSAIREFVTNAKDTLGKYIFRYNEETNMAEVIDFGTGLTQTSFVFGESTRNDSQIGQFGEGIKMALLTSLRLNRKCLIKTVGFNVKVIKANAYGTEVMKLIFEKNEKKQGTEVYVECSKKEFEETQELFLDIVNPEQLGEGIYKNGGKIYILGLLTSKLDNMLFSYNILDKSMTNRDRNIVAADKLNYNISLLLEKTKSQKVISQYLSNIENSNMYEYQLPLNIKYKKIWLDTLHKLYGEKVVLSSNPNSDLKAIAMGYKVLHEVSNNVKNILTDKLKVQYSIYLKYNGEGLIKDNKTIYPISKDYIEDWTISKAIGELMANAIDTNTHHSFEYKDGYGYIIDNGNGISKKNLIIGNSSKSKDDTNIGCFGEGLKMALLVLAKTKNIDITIKTVGHTYKAIFEYDDSFNEELFTIYEEANNNQQGTTIYFKCLETDFEKAKNLFLTLDDNEIIFENDKIQVFNRKRDQDSLENDIFGYIYVNGYRTIEKPLLYSYNIKNKEILKGRDRNNISEYIICNYISFFLSETIDEEVISNYLQVDNVHYLEYNLLYDNFKPKDIKLWKSIFKEMYGKVCTSGNNNENFVAMKMGYTILNNYPDTVQSLFRRMRITNSSTIYERHKDKGFLSDNKIVYPIQYNYSNWSISKAIQELISNALDTKTTTNIETIDKNTIIIEDEGKGFSEKALLLGGSKKKNSIGKFGEGLKLAALTFAKENRQFKIETQNIVCEAKIEKSKQYNTKVLVFDIRKVEKKRKGTKIILEATQEELNSAKNNFLIYNDLRLLDNNIYYADESNNSNKVFVNGVYVSCVDCIFSYNLKDTDSLINRDRNSIVDYNELKNQIKYNIEFSTNKEVIKKLLTDSEIDNLEHHISIVIPQATIFIWQEVMEDTFKKCCIPMNNENDSLAIDEGYTLLTNISPMQKNILLQLGMKYSKEVVCNNQNNDFQILNENELTMDQIDVWNKAKNLFKKIYGNKEIPNFKLVHNFASNLDTMSDQQTLGMYHRGTQCFYILVNLLNQEEYSFSKLLGVMVHEYLHKKSNAHDRTREFENALTDEIGNLLNLIKK